MRCLAVVKALLGEFFKQKLFDLKQGRFPHLTMGFYVPAATPPSVRTKLAQTDSMTKIVQ